MSTHGARTRTALLALSLILATLAGVACVSMRAASGPPVSGRGAVASAEPLATSAGLEILRAGGNAVDAAVAVALALAVVHPQAGNLGGGGFALVRMDGALTSLDFREVAPSGAHARLYLDSLGRPRKDASVVGPLAAGVPGSPAGLYTLQRRFGRLPWRRVVAPGVSLARDGFAVSERLHRVLAEEREALGRFPETAAVWLPGGEPLATGALLRLPDLAAALQGYAHDGPEALTRGPVASRIVEASRRHGGILTAADLGRYQPAWRDPLVRAAFGWEIASMPLPSSGGIILAQALAMLERRGFERLPAGGTERAHLLIEVSKRAYADRFLLGDPIQTRAGAADLLDPSWIARRADSIDLSRATPSDDVSPWPDAARAEPGAAAAPAHGETTHLSVIDGAGGAVALTTTLNGWFGCALYVPGAGFFLNNEMDDFVTAPGQPNLYGLIQGEANAVRAGARPLSSMAPTIAWRGADLLVLGSRGGSRIPTAVLQVLLALIVDGERLQDAVDGPRLHHQWRPDEALYEPGAMDDIRRAGLERLGHHLRAVDGLAEVHAVRASDAGLEAAADPRGPGGAGVTGEGPGSARPEGGRTGS